ncbi:ArnT family glycosyltransferase [Streptomyces sp. NPDC002206]
MTDVTPGADRDQVVRTPVPPVPPPLALRRIAAVSAGTGVLLLALGARYGYHRDELYYRAAGDHLAWGYDDQPPLVVLLARAETALLGDSPTALRTASAVAVALTVLLVGLIARELGGGARAQTLAALAWAVAPLTVISGHLLSTTTLDLLVWTLISWLVVRMVRTRAHRLWLMIGLVTGVGLLNKYLVVLFVVALLTGMFAAGPRTVLRTRWLPAGAALALLISLPDLLWQAAHGWPQFELARAIAQDGDQGGRAGFLPFQLLLTGPLMAPLWAVGLWQLGRVERLRPYRLFVWAYGALALVFLVTGGKAYYQGGAYPVLLAAGALTVEEWLARAGRRAWRGVRTGIVAVSGAVTVLIGLPVVPLAAFADSPQPAVNGDSAETVGWPQLAATVSRVYRTLPPAERGATTIVTRNYGEAGALARYGDAYGLPTAYSGHNAYHRWGPPPSDRSAVTLFVGARSAGELRRYWREVEPAARIDNGYGVDNEEQGAEVWICRGLREPWPEIWPAFRHLG